MKDVRSSSIAIHMRHGQQTTTALCIDFQDGRWFEHLETPYVRLKEVLGRGDGERKSLECPCALHLIIFSSAERWWQEVMKGINQEVLVQVGFQSLSLFFLSQAPILFDSRSVKF